SSRPGPLVVLGTARGHPVRTPPYAVDKLCTRCLVSAASHRRGARRGGEMAKRLLVTSAGTGPSNNLIRSLRAGHPSVTIIGGHDDPSILQTSAADRRYRVPSAGPAWARALGRIAREV